MQNYHNYQNAESPERRIIMITRMQNDQNAELPECRITMTTIMIVFLMITTRIFITHTDPLWNINFLVLWYLPSLYSLSYTSHYELYIYSWQCVLSSLKDLCKHLHSWTYTSHIHYKSPFPYSHCMHFHQIRDTSYLHCKYYFPKSTFVRYTSISSTKLLMSMSRLWISRYLRSRYQQQHFYSIRAYSRTQYSG